MLCKDPGAGTISPYTRSVSSIVPFFIGAVLTEATGVDASSCPALESSVCLLPQEDRRETTVIMNTEQAIPSVYPILVVISSTFRYSAVQALAGCNFKSDDAARQISSELQEFNLSREQLTPRVVIRDDIGVALNESPAIILDQI